MRLNNKNKLFIIGFLLVLYICYSFAISNTVNYYKEYKNKQGEITADSNKPALVGLLIQKEKQLNEVLENYDIENSESFQNDLLKQLTSYSENYKLKIVDFQQPHVVSEKGFTRTSYIFSLEGSFNGCLALINKIENTASLGSVRHINFVKTRNFKINTDQLNIEVILEKNQGI